MPLLTARSSFALVGSAVALAVIASVALTPAALPEARPQAAIVLPAEVTSAASATSSLAGGATIQLEGTRLDELTAVRVGGVSGKIDSAGPTSAVVVVPPSATYDAGTATVQLWQGDEPVAAPDVEVVYEVQTAVDRQMEYAFDHWNDYNIAQYGDFNVWGGDCMNFVSQTLVARGWQPTADWFNSAQEDWAPAFVHVPSFDAWLREHPEYGATTLTLDQRDQVKIGDVVLFDWEGDGSLDHAQVVSQVTTNDDGSVSIAMVGHNLDSIYRDLDYALTTQGKSGATAFFWSIP